MVNLNRDECRVLGTMIEKAQTVPGQYPITLNALTNGCNQKNNRDPVTSMSEDQVFEAVDTLRGKGIVREVMLSGSRVAKFRHVAREIFAVSTEELVILAELWLRGPQSAAELRANASRMAPLESVESVTALLHAMAARPEPFVKELSRRPGERTTRFVQLISPDLHDVSGAVHADAAGAELQQGGRVTDEQLVQRLERLEKQWVELKASVDSLVAAVGRLG